MAQAGRPYEDVRMSRRGKKRSWSGIGRLAGSGRGYASGERDGGRNREIGKISMRGVRRGGEGGRMRIKFKMRICKFR